MTKISQIKKLKKKTCNSILFFKIIYLIMRFHFSIYSKDILRWETLLRLKSFIYNNLVNKTRFIQLIFIMSRGISFVTTSSTSNVLTSEAASRKELEVEKTNLSQVPLLTFHVAKT